ncbi:MAG TPA: T6SS immunity protein Tli4 family protein [Bryobacteraceae bacterium]|nr:T6SS immunity protein Tli4 family protein [Bryobacteraceae bacterium]
MSVECTGRFRLSVPDGMLVTSRSQSIYGVEVKTVPAKEDSADVQWARRVESLGAAVQSKLSFDGGARGIWVRANPAVPSSLTLEASRAVGSHVLWLTTNVTAGKEELGEKLIRKLLSVYSEGTDSGFCVGAGSIRMEGSLSESARMTLEWLGGKPGKIEFGSQTVTEPDMRTFMDLEEEKQFAKASGAALDVRMERERALAGLVGKEMRVAIALPNEAPQLRYTWHYPGQGRNPAHPKINLIGRVPASEQARLDTAWEAVLASLRTVPMSN